MTSIIKKIAVFLALAGLLTWGVATMAQGPAIADNSIEAQPGIQQYGQTLDAAQGVEADRNSLRPVD